MLPTGRLVEIVAAWSSSGIARGCGIVAADVEAPAPRVRVRAGAGFADAARADFSTTERGTGVVFEVVAVRAVVAFVAVRAGGDVRATARAADLAGSLVVFTRPHRV
jgi:hypothetical protein